MLVPSFCEAALTTASGTSGVRRGALTFAFLEMLSVRSSCPPADTQYRVPFLRDPECGGLLLHGHVLGRIHVHHQHHPNPCSALHCHRPILPTPIRCIRPAGRLREHPCAVLAKHTCNVVTHTRVLSLPERLVYAVVLGNSSAPTHAFCAAAPVHNIGTWSAVATLDCASRMRGTNDHLSSCLLQIVLGTLLAALVPVVGFNAVMTSEHFGGFLVSSLFFLVLPANTLVWQPLVWHPRNEQVLGEQVLSVCMWQSFGKQQDAA